MKKLNTLLSTIRESQTLPVLNDTLIIRAAKTLEIYASRYPLGYEVKGNFVLRSDDVTTLKGCPIRVQGDFTAAYNHGIKSFEHSPNLVSGDFEMNDCRITSLAGLKIKAKSVDLNDNQITSLRNIHEHIETESLYINFNPIASNVLGLFKIKGLKTLEAFFNPTNTDDDDLSYMLDGRNKMAEARVIVEQMFNKFGATNRGLIECQEALLDADLEEFAHL